MGMPRSKRVELSSEAEYQLIVDLVSNRKTGSFGDFLWGIVQIVAVVASTSS